MWQVRDVHGQGVDEDGAGMGAGLNGGGFFELPGCATSYAAAGTCGKDNGKEPSEGNRGSAFVTGEGAGEQGSHTHARARARFVWSAGCVRVSVGTQYTDYCPEPTPTLTARADSPHVR